ncbi:hypothetical protein L2E82_00982 [Cichorium intybus]|uniref:Uncharacterized protein n=1 Tax=Cichorium intybus TaxID=13427 RepID=A0ACB9GZ28_CICIN|nr:hypothetical protein L2E82_00982 [Cichorium intybus]
MVISRINRTTQTKNVSFYEDKIFTTVTKDPNYVDAWISETIENSNGRRLVIGMDAEWRPSWVRGVENRVAILQLCVGHRCLIFQIIHAPYIPQSLIDFLNNPSYTITGVGIQDDAEKLVRHYSLGREAYGQRLAANVMELGWLAAQMHGDENMKRLGLKRMAGMFLGKEPKKPKRVTLSNWDNRWLSPKQIDYACIDAFLSFEIGRVLIQ